MIKGLILAMIYNNRRYYFEMFFQELHYLVLCTPILV